MSIEGVDYSWARPGGAALKAAGKRFAWRYLYADGLGGKGLDRSEYDDLVDHGIEVVVGYESTARRALDGRTAGVDDAKAAQSQLSALGLPNTPVYFAVDFDIPDYALSSNNAKAKLGKVAAYFEGVNSVLGINRSGGYGGYWLVRRLFDAKLVSWGFQTYAWSGGQWDKRAQLQQYLNGQYINGAVDFCRATVENYGQVGKFGQSAPKSKAPKGDNMATLTTKTDLNMLYQAMLGRPHHGNEGYDVYLNKDYRFVANDLYNSVPAKAYRKQVASQAAKVDSLQEQLADTNKTVRQLQTSVNHLKTELADADDKGASRSNQLKQLKAQVASLTKVNSNLQKQLATTGNDTTNLNALGKLLHWFLVRLGLRS